MKCSRMGAVGLGSMIFSIGLCGCERWQGEKETDAAGKVPTASIPGQEAPMPLDPRLHQPFTQATRSEPPADWQRPPDRTLSDKSVGKLYTDVVALWDSIQFQTSTGKPISYHANLDTEVGEIEIALRPNLAPNHVRNFIALARAGYYDGLIFERTIHAISADDPEVEIQRIEGGCPLGRGEVGLGSIGYWLKAEFSPELHEAGIVGACRGEDVDSAACRFYITLNKSPSLDQHFTVFGKVTSGLDVARRILSLPVRNDAEYPEGDRPERPVVIRKVAIHSSEDHDSDSAAP
jgi:peptidyl-prolyl cis-trans isomerase B (cyclophilin B)